ncbi:hypothetical protein [Paenibacillus xylaniclasticus]|nr:MULTISPECIES: hypothetical protein [Paenibacillus]GFN32429.1 hypothetical protein PCURB6_26890 [Paenibacillus curdlanolyticus]
MKIKMESVDVSDLFRDNVSRFKRQLEQAAIKRQLLSTKKNIGEWVKPLL